jgi:predicted phage terminase large subunit-like protein
LWLDCLQKVADGKIKRLLGMMPPGSSKSTYTSVVFPAWYLGRFSGRQIILASYGSDLPKKLGRRARSIINQPIYQRVFDTQLSDESAAADEWSLTNGSEWMAAGILTGITGNRADGIIWDDLVKGRQDADSEVIRQKTWDEYMESLLSRKKPTSFEVGISTRWHEDDVAGRILPADYNGECGWVKCRDGCDWYVVCLPAEAEKENDILGRKIGERLWPEWFTEDHFRPYKLNPRTWNALYQQRPAPETGAFFEADWFKPYSVMPKRETLNVYGASDFAVSEGKGDFTVHVVVGIDPQHRMYLLDFWRAQAKADKTIEALCNLVEKWHPLGWAEESGQIKAALGPFLERRLRERRLYVRRAMFPTKGEGKKEIRAQSIAGRMGRDGLWVPMEQPWWASFRKEMLTFPYAAHDDIPDAMSLIGQVLDKMVSGTALGPPPPSAKIISTDPNTCTVTIEDLWGANDRPIEKEKSKILRIH